MSNYFLIKKAIQKKQCITCQYKGLNRKMSPHSLGLKNGKEHALFYQYDGQSKSGIKSNSKDNWRCIEISQLTNLSINNDFFHTALNHSTAQTCIDTIDVEVVL